MASSLDRVRRDLLAGRVETVNTGAVSGNAARVRSLQNRAERDQRFADYMDRVDAGEVLTREEIDDMRQSRTDTGRQMQQDYYRRQAEQALAQFEANERARQWDAELAERHGFHEAQEQRRIDEELRAARRAAYTDPDYRAYNREGWKNTQRPTSDLRYSQQQTAAVQRQRDRLTSGNSYLGRQYAQQEQAMSDNMRRPSDFMNPSQEDLNAAAQYRDVTERYQNTLDRLNNEAEQAQRQLRTVAEPNKEANDYELRYRGAGNPVEAARALESVWNPNRYSITDRDGTRIARDVYNSVNGVPGQEQMDVRIDQMSDAEKATVLNMAQAGKWSDIEKYTNDLQATLDARWYDTQSQRIAQMPKAAQVGYGMLGTVTAPAAYAQVAADTLLGRYIDPKSGAVGATRLTQEARERSLENAGTVGRFAGNVAYSMADNLVTMALGPTGAVVWLGLSAGGNEAANALANGATQRQAFAKGTTSGAIEAATEKIGIDNLFDTALKSGSRGIKNALKDIAKQFGSEGAEEIISEFANTFADKAIMGQQSEYNNAIRDYEASGLSHDDAVKRANLDFFVKNPGLAGLAGALSGALFGVGGVATQRIRQGASDLATGRYITDNRQIADLVLDEGMKSTDERVKALSYALDTVRQENRNSEGFQWSNSDLREIGEVYDSLDDAAKKRISDDYAERERTRQEEEAERVRAREAEIQAEQDARAREDAQRALAEREAETDRIVEDAEAIDLDNPDALTEEADTTARRGSDEYTDRVETAEDVDADMRRRAAAAEEATRTGDRSALDNLEQSRRTTESTAQTNGQTAQQEPVNPTQQRRDMKKQVRDVYSSMGITSEVSVGEIADAMQEAYNAIREKGDGSDSLDERKAFLSSAQEHFDMLRQAEEDRDRQFGAEDEVYTQARKTIRGTRLYVPQSLNASELGVDSFNEFRRANFGVLNLTRDNQAMPIDTFYDELVREYPGLFPDPGSEGGPTSEADMLRTIAEVYRSRGSAMQAEPIDTDAINAESKRKAMELYRPMVEAAQQTYTTAQTTARQNAEQAGQTTANNARRAGLSAADSLALSNVARDLGVGLEFRKMKYGRVNGFYNRETNTVVLNQDLSTAEMAWTTFAHEIVHAAETAGNYQQLADIAKRISVKDADKGTEDATWRGTVDELRRVYAQEGFKISRESAEHEAVTNILQDVLGSREALEGVARESKANGRALLSDVDNVLDRTTTNNAAITPEAARLAEAQKALAAALNDAQENARYTASVPGQQVEASISGINMDEIIKTAVEKYGRMRPGEQLVDEQGNPVTRKVDMANAYSDGMQARSLYRTAAEANNVTVDVKTRAVLDQYKPTSNQENVDRANEMRGKYSNFDQAYGAWRQMVDKGLSSRYGVLSNQIAFAETLMMEAQKEGRSEDALNILSDLAQFGTTAGQAVQALSLIKRLSPEGQLMHYNRVVENFANSGKKGKVPAEVQTVNVTQETLDKLLNNVTELRKLKRLEANGDQMNEAVARRIAELEKEIEELQTKLGPLLDKFNRLTGEKNATTLERNKLKREEKALPDRIKATEERIAEIQAEIDELNKKLDPKRKELLALLAEEGTTRERRKELKKELDSINRRIETKQRQIAQHRADILALMAQMSVKNIKLPELQRYERVLKTSKEIMDTYLRYTKNKGGRVVVPAELQTEYLNAKTDAEREAVRAKMDAAIAEQLPGTWSEKIRGWRYISMLFNPTTHFRNLTGNAVQYGLKGMRDTLAAWMERRFIRDDGERTKAIANRFIPADKAYFDAARADYNIIEDDLKAGGKASETQGIENLRKIYSNKYAEAVRRFSGDLLEREDKIFLRANYTQSFAEYLKANKIDPANMTDAQKERARQIAFQQALEATYRDASTIASVLNDLEKKGAGWEFALGGIMPFKKTPVNVLKRGVEYSPAGIIKATYDMIQMTRGKNAKTKSDIIGEYASGLTGIMVAALGMFAARAGIAFASPGDDDKDRKKAMDEATGQQDYAIKFNIGGKEWTYTFDWVAPASMAFFAGVRAVEAFRSKDKIDLQGILDGLITTINPIFELSMLDGLTGMFRSYASDESGAAAAVAWSVLESYILQFFPTVGGKLARTIDPYQRSTYSPKDSAYTKNLERLYRRVMAKIPGASYMLEPIIDQYGNPKENIGKNFIGRLGYNLTSPGYYKPVTHFAADEEMKRLYAQVGETYVLPKETPTSWEFDGETYYLDSTEYSKWGERQGKYVYDELDKLYQTQEYKAANDTQKAKMVGKVIEAGTQYAKLGFFEDIGLIDDYYRHELDGLVYDDTQGYRQYKTIPEATEIYEQGRIDLKTVYDANETLKGISGNAARIDAMNKMNLDSDEYNFLYMTKIASNEMEADISAVINAGGSLDRAVNIVSQFYKWDANAENKTIGEKGAWVSIGNGAKAEVLAQSNMTLPAIETMYLRVLTPADDVEKQTELINEFKSAGKNIKDYLNTKAVLYDGGVSKYKKTSDIAQAFLDSDLPDDLKELGYKTLGSDAQGVPDEIAAFKKARMTIDDYLRTKAVVGKTDADGNGLKNYEKARELLKMDLKSYTAAITSVITSSENQATGIQNCLNVGISDRKVAEGYAKYAEINANDALNATQKATEFSKWLNTDSSMSGLTTAQRDMMRASFVYFMMTPASAGRYDNLMKLDGMSSNAAESISADIAKLEPKEGSKSVSDLQRLTAVAYNTTASEKQIDLAMQQILDSSDDGTDTAGLTKYRAIRAAGMSAKQYVDFRTNTESITSDKDSNGKDIKGRTRQDKIWAYINSLPISSKQKDALHLVYYKESTLSKTPWH